MTDPINLAQVRAQRAHGEGREVQFDPMVHPGVAYRMYSTGRTHEEVAAAIGVTTLVLDNWLDREPEMEKARAKALERNAEILQSLEDHAIGVMDEATGKYVGGCPPLLRFLGETRLGMVKPVRLREEEPEARLDGMTPDQLLREAKVLKRKLERASQGGSTEPGGSTAGAPWGEDGSPG